MSATKHLKVPSDQDLMLRRSLLEVFTSSTSISLNGRSYVKLIAWSALIKWNLPSTWRLSRQRKPTKFSSLLKKISKLSRVNCCCVSWKCSHLSSRVRKISRSKTPIPKLASKNRKQLKDQSKLLKLPQLVKKKSNSLSTKCMQWECKLWSRVRYSERVTKCKRNNISAHSSLTTCVCLSSKSWFSLN